MCDYQIEIISWVGVGSLHSASPQAENEQTYPPKARIGQSLLRTLTTAFVAQLL